jgi:hypothetical protein
MLTSQIGLAQSSSDPLETAIFKNGIWLGGGASWSDIDSSLGSLNYVDDSFGYNLGIGYQFLNYFGVVAKWKEDTRSTRELPSMPVSFSTILILTTTYRVVAERMIAALI